VKKSILPKKQKGFAIQGIVIVAIIVVLAVLLFSVVRKQVSLPFSEKGWQNYSSSSLGFSVSYPSSWNVKEEIAETGPDLLISSNDNSAFVRVRGLLDPHLNSAEAISLSIDGYKKMLVLQESVIISDFQIDEIKDGTGGILVSGQFPINGINYRFEERGQLSTAGHALIMRAADVPENFDSSLPVMKKLMDSFKLQ